MEIHAMLNGYDIRFEDDDEDEDDEKDNKGLKELFEGLSENRLFSKRFLQQRKIFLWGPVMDASAKDLVNRLLYLEAEAPGKEITFYINSPGGVVTSGMVIYDTMQMISSPVSTVCMGLAASMGSILLSAGTKGKRYIYPSGRVMIHQPSIGGLIQGVAADIAIHAREIGKTKEMGARILAENCGQTFEKVMKDFDRDYWMDAKESLEYGIVDQLIEKL
ncbi:MAG: ATP-dependent Clp protease proteolytic subunit [Candidatus Melainabacteria bacterium HGW-Melainabacteria-1]|nr:MAG: ATP-dependent Clp protease proteolytic subunit [Candidatus Melainabacteria bacterium HGW-Melainabacteria-1]